MGYGSTNGGTPSGGLTGGVPARGAVGVSGKPTFTTKKSVSYVAGGADSNLI